MPGGPACGTGYRSGYGPPVRPPRDDIAAPPFPPGTEWVGGREPTLDRLVATGPLLVHFFDFAQLNCVRAMPYVGRGTSATAARPRRPRRPLASLRRSPTGPGRRGRAAARLGIDWPVARRLGAQRSGGTTGAAAGPRCSFGDAAARCAGTTSARATTRRPSRRSAMHWRRPTPTGPGPSRSSRMPRRRRARRAGDAPHRRAAPGRIAGPALDGRGAWRSPTRPAAPSSRPTARARSRSAWMAEARDPVAVDRPGLHPVAVHDRHESHWLELDPGPGVEIYSVSSPPKRSHLLGFASGYSSFRPRRSD